MLDPVMSTQREQQKARMAAAASRRAAPNAGPPGSTAIRSDPVRITLDLSPELYRQLKIWVDSAAVTRVRWSKKTRRVSRGGGQDYASHCSASF